LVIQEVDTYGTVYFQWRSWDHFLITDATDDINLLAANIDYVHGNAFEFDLDGNLLISSRHLDEITKINYETGDVIYRFGLLSKNNEFIINNDPIGFSGPIFMILPVHNNSEQLVRVTSTFNHNELFGVVDDLPVSIPAGESTELTISFYPDSLGVYNDRLTLNYDKFGLGATERIARQVSLCGVWDNTLPIISYLPEYGAIDVDPESNVVVSFSEPIRKVGGALIQDSDIPDLFSFSVSNLWGDSVHFNGTISEDRQQITLSPVETLNELEQYFVELHSLKIEDDDGGVIEHPEATVFKTGLSVYITPDRNKNDVLVFPSPFSNRLVISSQNNIIDQVYIYNGSGLLVLHLDSKKEQYEINTSNFTEGIYLVKVLDKSGEVKVVKIVKVA